MTTAAQHLVALSGLPSGSAAQHLLAIQLGTGAGQTIYCSQRTVVFEQDETTITRKPKRRAAVEQPIVQPAQRGDKQQRDIVAMFSQPSLVVTFDGADEMTITQRTERLTATSRSDEQVVTRKRKTK